MILIGHPATLTIHPARNRETPNFRPIQKGKSRTQIVYGLFHAAGFKLRQRGKWDLRGAARLKDAGHRWGEDRVKVVGACTEHIHERMGSG